MSDYAGLVESLLRPRLLALAAVDPTAAGELASELAGSSEAFQRGAPEVAAGALLGRVGTHGSWVWGVANCHHRSFATLASGRAEADGVVPVSFDVADAEEEHATPWRWDLITVLASVALVKPGQKGSAFAALMGRTLDGYVAALQAAEAPAEPSDLPGALQRMIDTATGQVAADRHLSAHVHSDGGEARLRLGAGLSRDLPARAFFLPALNAAWGDAARVTVLDVVRRDQLGFPYRGRRGWLGLIRERHALRSERLRLIDIRERPPSALARVVMTSPFPPQSGPALRLSVVLGSDPFQRLLHGPAATYAVRSFCHCRQTVDITDLDEPELARLVRVWGVVLGNFHLRGLKGVRVDAAIRAREIVAEVAEARRDLARQAWEHAAHLDKAHLAWRKLSRELPGA